MRLKTIKSDRYKKYLSMAKRGQWPYELEGIGIYHPDFDRGDIPYDRKLTGEASATNYKDKPSLNPWWQIEQIAKAYAIAWLCKDFEFTENL